MLIRAAHIDELSLLQDIERAAGECFRAIGMPEIADDEPLPLEELLGYRRAGLVWVAAEGTGTAEETGATDGTVTADSTGAAHGTGEGTPVGYLIADRVDGNLHVEQVSVHPDRAHRRIGRSLLEHLAERAAAEGAPALTLTTFTDVPWNAPYYARCGFRILDDSGLGTGLRDIRDREAVHGLDRWPRVCMRRDLRPGSGR
ncbi:MULTISPECIES: GNAT family N-acetyltransferase [unclassified Streptomyces]|uniref:GNAT family N-acetyltransferase n=1 Tax=unclassified Streptomyces TaxID=2593676 RepID=UPI000DC7C3CD|nr:MULTISPECIES: GNAT family N-acetyltransferase [unclassified Streptomyces]AWZ05371.1 GNAT family N-acetyltransferase [Streptomyces sp. ICC4]AWZ13154.1 GNAT family N-acetyltransferase [Streptomyces sp. ICC1]